MALRRADAATTLLRSRWPGRIENAGVENLTIAQVMMSATPWTKTMPGMACTWLPSATVWCRWSSGHLAGSAAGAAGLLQVTAEDCLSRQPVSEPGGSRRHRSLPMVSAGSFQRLWSEEGINDCGGMLAAGPNAFVQCESQRSHLSFMGLLGPGPPDCSLICVLPMATTSGWLHWPGEHKIGWNTTNSTAYQCSAAGIQTDSLPDGSTNVAYGSGRSCQCTVAVEANAPCAAVEPLCQATGRQAGTRRAGPHPHAGAWVGCGHESYHRGRARQMTLEAHRPRVTMAMWVDSVGFTASVSPRGATDIDKLYRGRWPRHRHPPSA